MTDGPDLSPAPRPLGRSEIRFAHASEAEFARILDFYQVRWLYEPEVFPILWDLDGNVVESFTPDFYLPDFDMFVEMTTLQQRLVRKKNRKVRRLRELYPFLSIKLFYARDFRALMLKYGRVALIDELSGATGQTSAEMRLAMLPVPVTSPASLPGPLAEPPPQPAVANSSHAAAGMPVASTTGGRSRAARRRAARRAAIALAHQAESR